MVDHGKVDYDHDATGHRRLTVVRTPPASIPIPLTPLIAREQEAATIAGWIRGEGERLVTLTGPGGVGKTRLAVQVAHEVTYDFVDGVFFVGLAAVTSPSLVVPTIAQVFGLAEPDAITTNARLRSLLGKRRCLLVLDNFEHVIDAVSDVAALLSDCGSLSVLVTSRALLSIRGERAFAVQPLDLPQPGVPTAEPTAAERLFIDRARAVNSDIPLDADATLAMAEICRRLDGLPLAIELAAARSAVLPPSALLERMERRLPILTSGPRDLPQRQRTMRDTIAWSHDLLSEDEQMLFRRLAVFVDGFTLEAVETVCQGSEERPGGGPRETPRTRLNQEGMLDLLQSLVANSLVRFDPAGSRRFGMLETIREYATEQLQECGEAAPTRRRHAMYMRAFAERHAFVPFLPFTAADLTSVGVERGNFHAALQWLADSGEQTELVHLVAALGWFWWSVGHGTEELPWLERAWESIQNGQVDVTPTAIPLVLATILTASGSDLERAEAILVTALDRCRAIGDAYGQAALLTVRGWLHHQAGGSMVAITWLEDALTIAQGVTPLEHASALRASILNNLGGAARELRTFREAAAYQTEALQLSRAIGFVRGIIRNLVDLGFIHLFRGDPETARNYLQDGLRLVPNQAERRYELAALEGLAAVFAATAPERSGRLFGAFEALSESSGITEHGPLGQDGHERAYAVCRAALGSDGFDAAYQAGRALTRDDAFSLALEPLAQPPARSISLTRRERDVLRLVVAGMTDPQIGEALFLSVRTVESHVARLLAKLDVHTRAAAVSAAFAARLVELPTGTPPTDADEPYG